MADSLNVQVGVSLRLARQVMPQVIVPAAGDSLTTLVRRLPGVLTVKLAVDETRTRATVHEPHIMSVSVGDRTVVCGLGGYYGGGYHYRDGQVSFGSFDQQVVDRLVRDGGLVWVHGMRRPRLLTVLNGLPGPEVKFIVSLKVGERYAYCNSPAVHALTEGDFIVELQGAGSVVEAANDLLDHATVIDPDSDMCMLVVELVPAS